MELEDWVEKVLQYVNINSFFTQLLMYLEVNGRSFKKIPNSIWTLILHQELSQFVKYFVENNKKEGLELVMKKFDPLEFE